MSKSITKGKKSHISNRSSSANVFWMASYCVEQNTLTEAFLVTCKLFSYKELAHLEIVWIIYNTPCSNCAEHMYHRNLHSNCRL